MKSLLVSLTLLVSWWANPEPDIANYVVCQGTASRSYTVITNVGNRTNVVLPPMPGTNFIAVTAVNTSGLESDFSEEVSIEIPVIVTNTILTATNINGPWTALTQQVLRVYGHGQEQYFKSVMGIKAQ